MASPVSTSASGSHDNESSTPARGHAAVVAALPVGAAAKAKTQILIVDDERTMRESCVNVLSLEGYDVTSCGRGDEARDLLRRRAFDIVLVDLYMTPVDGMTLLRTVLEARPRTLVIVMTGNPSVDSSIEALREGAWDYLPKPFSAAHLQVLVGRAAHTVLLGRENTPAPANAETPQVTAASLTLLGSTPAFRKVIELARRVAPTDASVFITGESGSGKELVARFIHQHSRRVSRPFVAVNCAALPEMLLESEMFGHRKGAFTGAVRDKPGLFETANGGTLFLDELIEMPKASQSKLLRVIQDGVVRRVGSEETDAIVNVRIIAATNGDPKDAARRGELREDLYYRLCVVPIHLPPLRERPEDIPLLADHFLSTFWAKRHDRAAQAPEFTEPALRALCAHPWRGNVRELQNVIEHVAVLAEPGTALRPDDLPLRDDPHSSTDASRAALVASVMEESYHPARERVIAQFETQYLHWLIARAGGNMSEAARIAGVDRTTLYRLMERHGLQRQPNAGLVTERPTPNVAAHAIESAETAQ
jgi:DNA-binding NtrC family response regulator